MRRCCVIVIAVIMLVAVFTCMPAVSLHAEISETINGYDARVIDNADLFDDSEEAALFERIRPITEYGNIILLTEAKVSTSDTGAYAKQWYNSRYGRQSGTVFVIDMDNRYLFIFSNGANYNVITDSVADNITDNVFRYAKSGDYYSCADVAFEQIGTVLAGGKIAMPMKYISNALFSLGLAMLICYIYASARSRAQRSSNKELLTYVNKAFNYSTPTLTYRRTEKKYSPQSSGGGSSGGGGDGGGGGGGGGHGF